MDFPIQPKVADGWICGKTPEGGGSVPSGVGRWNHYVITYAGAAITAFMAGAASAAGTRLSDSQNVNFQVTDKRRSFHSLRLCATNDHYLVLQRDDAGVADLDLVNGNLLLQAGHGVYVAGRPLVGGPVPASATSPCSPGAMTSDSTYIYLCVAENTWKRAPLSGWQRLLRSHAIRGKAFAALRNHASQSGNAVLHQHLGRAERVPFCSPPAFDRRIPLFFADLKRMPSVVEW